MDGTAGRTGPVLYRSAVGASILAAVSAVASMTLVPPRLADGISITRTPAADPESAVEIAFSAAALSWETVEPGNGSGVRSVSRLYCKVARRDLEPTGLRRGILAKRLAVELAASAMSPRHICQTEESKAAKSNVLCHWTEL